MTITEIIWYISIYIFLTLLIYKLTVKNKLTVDTADLNYERIKTNNLKHSHLSRSHRGFQCWDSGNYW